MLVIGCTATAVYLPASPSGCHSSQPLLLLFLLFFKAVVGGESCCGCSGYSEQHNCTCRVPVFHVVSGVTKAVVGSGELIITRGNQQHWVTTQAREASLQQNQNQFCDTLKTRA